MVRWRDVPPRRLGLVVCLAAVLWPQSSSLVLPNTPISSPYRVIAPSLHLEAGLGAGVPRLSSSRATPLPGPARRRASLRRAAGQPVVTSEDPQPVNVVPESPWRSRWRSVSSWRRFVTAKRLVVAVALAIFATTRRRVAVASEIAVSFDEPLKFTKGFDAAAAAAATQSSPLPSLAPWVLPALVTSIAIIAIQSLLFRDRYLDDLDGDELQSMNGTSSRKQKRGLAGVFPFSLVSRTLGSIQSEDMTQRMNVLRGKASNAADSCRALWKKISPPTVELLPDDWASCVLIGKEPLGDSGTTKYTFAFKGIYQTFQLQLGQAMSLIALDEQSRVCRLETIPSSSRTATGYFEIILDDVPSPRFMTEEQTNFSQLIGRMELGEQLAARPGEKRMVYHTTPGSEPISEVHCIVNGLGIVPVVTMIKEILPNRDSSVELANLVWVNENAQDFVLYEDLERLYFKCPQKLEITCVVAQDVYGPGVWSDEEFSQAVPRAFRDGNLVIVAGPEAFQNNIVTQLRSNGVPDGAIMRV